MISRAASVFCFFAALFGSGMLLAEIRPFAAVPGLREKFAWLAAHADEYDTLFIGSSRICRGIKPAVFDELTAAAGVPTHSFNMGVDGMLPPEDAYVAEYIAALHPKRLRWVFLECGTVRPRIIHDVDDNVRNLHWHDATRTMLALRVLLAPANRPLRWSKILFGPGEEREALKQAGAHVRLWLMRTFNAGRGAFLLRSWLNSTPRVPLSTVIGPAGDGFTADDRPLTAEMRTEYLRDVAKASHLSTLDRDSQRSLDRMLARPGGAGASPILIIAPMVIKYRMLPQSGNPAPVLDYGEVEKWPALFQIDNRVDHSHLNEVGADLFTRAVAADFINLAKSRQ